MAQKIDKPELEAAVTTLVKEVHTSPVEFFSNAARQIGALDEDNTAFDQLISGFQALEKGFNEVLSGDRQHVNLVKDFYEIAEIQEKVSVGEVSNSGVSDVNIGRPSMRGI
jgi:hypothetical protein